MKYLSFVLLASIVLFGSRYQGTTTSAVVLAGGIIRATHIEPSDQKYKRKNCPVCKGTGQYLSGDGIKMVDCGYCEPEKNDSQISNNTIEIIHPPIIINQKCTNPNCRFKK